MYNINQVNKSITFVKNKHTKILFAQAVISVVPKRQLENNLWMSATVTNERKIFFCLQVTAKFSVN